MPGTSQLRVVQLTPPGRGAVATLLVEGPGAVEAVDSRFHAPGGRPLKSRPSDRLVLGRFDFSSGCGEELVVRRHSDRSVEVHCHGGRAAVAMIEKALAELGCRAVAWQDWAADHHPDPIAAAAHAALAEARTQRTAAVLLDQYHGALRRALEQIEQSRRNHDTAGASQLVETLLDRAELGKHLVRPWRVVLAGRANVGKSSLINALVGYPRAIVHHAPGTTRDVVAATTAMDGWPVELSDTAGLSTGGDAIERAGVRRAEEKLAGADLVVLVFDGSVFDAGGPWPEPDRALIEAWPEALVVLNKSDLAPRPRQLESRQACPGAAWLTTSAPTGSGIEALVRTIATRLVPNPPPPGAAVPFTAKQVEHLRRCSDSLQSSQ